jgi:hypothetical protein
MKYIKKREFFFKEIDSLYKYNKNDIKILNEVLSNDISWGDSLLGRLINSVIRKTKIGVNLVRIDGVIKSLYSLFDSLVSKNAISNIQSPNKIKIIRYAIIKIIAEVEKFSASKKDVILNNDIEICESVNELKDIVDKVINNSPSEIDKIINDSIKNLSNEDIKNLQKDKEEMIAALKEFRESLNKIEADQKASTDDFDDRNNKKSDVVLSDDIFPKILANFKSLYYILYLYHQLKNKAAKNFKDKQNVNFKKVSNDTRHGQNFEKGTNTNQEEDENLVSVEGDENIKDSYIIDDLSKYLMISEQQSSEILGLIKSIYNYTKQYLNFDFKDNDKRTIAEKLKQASSEFETSAKSNKDALMKVYSYIKRKSLVNEGVKELLTRPEAIGDKILKLYNVTKSNKGVSGSDIIYSDMNRYIREFNTTMESILSSKKPEFKEKNSIDNDNSKKESKLHRYYSFINENNETYLPDWYVKVNEFWKSIFLFKFGDKMKAYNLTNEQVIKLNKQLESISKDSKFINISGTDPIMEVVRLFNRAYRLHTVNTIPSGRSGGKVSNKTFREYDNVGREGYGTPDNPGYGPYRNKVIFSKWENAVLDILSNSKYRAIFDKNTTIKVGDSEPKSGFGPKFKSFMNDMLYGDNQQYGKNQHKFIEEYFEIKNVEPKETSFLGSNDSEFNSNISKNVRPTKQLEFKEVDVFELKNGKIFKILYKDDDNNEKSTYGYVYSDNPNNFYIKLGCNTLFFRKYIPSTDNIKTKLKIESDDIFFVNLKDNKLNKGVDYKLYDSLNISKYTSDETIELKNIKIKPIKISVLKDEEDDYIIENPVSYYSKKDSENNWIKIYNTIINDKSDALSALIKLGIKENEAKIKINKALMSAKYNTVNDLVKAALKK